MASSDRTEALAAWCADVVLPAPTHCLVCRADPGVRCCEFGADRPLGTLQVDESPTVS